MPINPLCQSVTMAEAAKIAGIAAPSIAKQLHRLRHRHAGNIILIRLSDVLKVWPRSTPPRWRPYVPPQKLDAAREHFASLRDAGKRRKHALNNLLDVFFEGSKRTPPCCIAARRKHEEH